MEITRQADYYGLPAPERGPAPPPEKVAEQLRPPTPWSGPIKVAAPEPSGPEPPGPLGQPSGPLPGPPSYSDDDENFLRSNFAGQMHMTAPGAQAFGTGTQEDFDKWKGEHQDILNAGGPNAPADWAQSNYLGQTGKLAPGMQGAGAATDEQYNAWKAQNAQSLLNNRNNPAGAGLPPLPGQAGNQPAGAAPPQNLPKPPKPPGATSLPNQPHGPR
jgi:hypothetical protein